MAVGSRKIFEAHRNLFFLPVTSLGGIFDLLLVIEREGIIARDDGHRIYEGILKI